MTTKDTTIAVIGSHSALDVCRGAKDQGFSTLVIAQKGREQTYSQYFKTHGNQGCVDECLILDRFDNILDEKIQKQILQKNPIFIPHRSFEVYLHFDYDAIEHKFQIPIFGNKHLLKIEERGVIPNQYDLLNAAQIRYPKQFATHKEIDRLCLVKVLEKERGFERAFFLCSSASEYELLVEEKMKAGVFGEEQIAAAIIEEFVMGVQVNFNFFYSPLTQKIELIGTDTRRQTNIEGFLKLPADIQKETVEKISLKYEEAGHVAVTVLESLLEDAFAMAERFVTASKKLYSPGVIGPFALQTIITAGPPKKELIVVDVSPRMPGSPGIAATPYSRYLHGQQMSMGDRVAMEIKQAIQEDALSKITT